MRPRATSGVGNFVRPEGPIVMLGLCDATRTRACPSFDIVDRGVVLKKKWDTPETRLRQRLLNNLRLHARTLIHVRKISTADLWSCPAIQLLVFECL